MFRGTVIAFIAGWVLWFWIDKNPYSLGPLPQPLDGDFTANFQMAIDLLKAGRYKAAFVYAWKAHYLVLSLGAGLLIAALGVSVSRALSGRRSRRLYIPAHRRRASGADQPQHHKAEASDPKQE